jgi:hypothetical protein
VRRAALLADGQSVWCINPDCKESWTVEKRGRDFRFARQTATVTCQGCGQAEQFPMRHFLNMRYDQKATALCDGCNHENYLMWRLMQVVKRDPPPEQT